MARGSLPRGTAVVVTDLEEFADEMDDFGTRLDGFGRGLAAAMDRAAVPPGIRRALNAQCADLVAAYRRLRTERLAPRLDRARQNDRRYAIAASWETWDGDLTDEPDLPKPDSRTDRLERRYDADYHAAD